MFRGWDAAAYNHGLLGFQACILCISPVATTLLDLGKVYMLEIPAAHAYNSLYIN